MRKFLLISIGLLNAVFSLSQVQEAWVARTRWSVESRFDAANDVVVDNSGNVYVVGTIEDADHIIDGDDPDGMVTIKYDKNGNLLWKSLFRRVQLEGSSIAIDPSGNVYVMGFQYFRGSGESVRTDFVTIKYNSAGVQQWQRSYNGPHSRGQTGYLGLDAANNVYIAGTSMGEEDDEGTRQPDYAVIKYDNNGNQLWVRRYNGAAPAVRMDELRGMIVDPAGNVYITGTSEKDGRISTTTIKYATNGTEMWVERNNKATNSTDEGNEITYDLDGNIYVTGAYKDGLNFGYETIKYSNDGTKQWASYYQIPNGHFGKATSIVVDHAQNSYVVGFSRNSSFDNPQGNIRIIKYNSAGVEQWNTTYNAIPPSSLLGVVFQYEDFIANIALGVDANLYIATSVRSNFLTLKYNSSNGSLIWEKEYNGPANNIDNARSIWLDASDNVYVTGTSNRGTTGHYDMTTVKYTQCELICPSNITVNNTAGTCGAVVTYPAATTSGNCGTEITYSYPSGTTFPVGTTTVTVRSTETGAECSFTVTVVDNQNPVFTSCPAGKTVNTDPGVCYATAASVNSGIATATDNCPNVSVTGTRSDGLALTANYPAGVTTITWTATDGSNNTATCTQTITVVDNVPPVISNASVSRSVLTPPNHKMVDVYVGYTVTDNCSASATISITSDEPESGLSNGDVGPDIIKINEHHVKLRAERDGKGDGRVYTITITATDGSGNVSTTTQTVVVAHNIGSPHSGASVKVGSTVNFSGTFWDVAGNRHTAKWLIDDRSVSGTVSEPSGMKNGTVAGSYKFTTPGVYKLKMAITDQKGITTVTTTNGDLEALIVVYDPNGGYTYGGGNFFSPAGALKADPFATGDVSYGYTVNYYKNASFPKGETQFEFKVADFEFNAVNFEYLAISGAFAQFKGTGKITGGQSGINFIMTVIDGQLDGSGVDKVRMKIYNRNTGEVFYDNQPGASDAAAPITSVGANSTITISSNNNVSARGLDLVMEESSSTFHAIASPNPSKSSFRMNITSSNHSERIKVKVVDAFGRVVEVIQVVANQQFELGRSYKPGVYIVELEQGKERKQLKLIKASN